MHPLVVITINGQPVSADFSSRLLSVTVHDKEGTRSDTIDLELEAGPPFISIPSKKAIIRSWFGYRETGTDYMGAFTADDVDLNCLPYKMKIQGKSADMRATLKQHGDKHWDDKPVKDIVSDIAREHGLQAVVAGSVGSHVYKWFGKEGESGLHAVERLARRHNAVFSVKDGKLIFAEKGKGLSVSGLAMGGVVVTPPMILADTCSVKFTERESHKKVRAAYHDTAEAKRKYVEVDADPEGEATHTLRHQYADEGEARRAATSRATDLVRRATSTSVTIVGNTMAKGGAPMSYVGVHPDVDGTQFVIEDAAHSYAKGQGYRTAINGKVKV